jgi:hypothetical protein
MKRFFSPNIDRKGRVVRAVWAAGLFIGAWFAFGISAVLGVVLIVSAVFALFEALRGWCVVRACGIKTRL